MRIDEALDGWFLHLRSKGASPHTLDRYGRVWRRFQKFLTERGIEEIEQLRPEHARAFIIGGMGGKNLGSTTRHYDVTPIKALTSWLEEMEVLDRDPFRKVKRPKLDRQEMQILRPAEAKRLLACMDRRQPDQFRDYVIVSLTLDTGLRRSEVLGAKVTDIDREERSLLVWGKGRKQRRVPLSPEVATLLWKWVNTTRKKWTQKTACDRLFVSRRGGPLDAHTLSRRFHAYVLRAGIERRVRFHDLRHTCATWSLKAGMPKERVSRMLGHSSDVVTSIYEHLDFSDIQAIHRETNPLRFVS